VTAYDASILSLEIIKKKKLSCFGKTISTILASLSFFYSLKNLSNPTNTITTTTTLPFFMKNSLSTTTTPILNFINN
jgi:hypothetical protein